jgi:hypothetical protein
MKLAAIVAAVLCLSAQGADKKRPSDLRVLDVKARRDGDLVVIDGRLRATGEKPIARLVLAFDFLDGGTVLVTKKAGIDGDALKAGDEAPFHVETDCPAKASEFKVNAFKNASVELNVVNSGPFPIAD